MTQKNFPVNPMHRPVGFTHYQHGRYDLQPQFVLPTACYGEIISDFESQSCRLPLITEASDQHWCPAYLVEPSNSSSAICADLLTIELPGISADHAYRWLIESGFAGMAFPTVRDSLLLPHCCLVVLLNRPVSVSMYSELWQRLARDIFADRSSQEQADFRYRIPYPRMINGQNRFLSAKGAALHVEFTLSRQQFEGKSIAEYSISHADEAWMSAPYSA